MGFIGEEGGRECKRGGVRGDLFIAFKFLRVKENVFRQKS